MNLKHSVRRKMTRPQMCS
jgi:hypothetical protein